jgi:lipopolysaccharide biosynthesis glycosyltransferase
MIDAEPADRRTSLPPVVLAVDDNYVRPLCVVLRSLATANADHLDALRIIVLHASLSPAAERQVTSHAADVGLSLELRRIGMDAGAYPTHGWACSAAYLRLKIAEMLPEYDRAVYLDCDLLVRADVTPLLTTDLGGAPMGAVQDVMNPVLECGFGLPGWASLGLEGSRCYFNSGVLVLDLPACRESEIFTRSEWFLANKSNHVPLWSQDALNWAADDRWARLSRHWNMVPISAMVEMFGTPPCPPETPPLDVLMDDERDARILHYAGPRKPWGGEYPAGLARDRYASVLNTVDARGL